MQSSREQLTSLLQEKIQVENQLNDAELRLAAARDDFEKASLAMKAFEANEQAESLSKRVSKSGLAAKVHYDQHNLLQNTLYGIDVALLSDPTNERLIAEKEQIKVKIEQVEEKSRQIKAEQEALISELHQVSTTCESHKKSLRARKSSYVSYPRATHQKNLESAELALRLAEHPHAELNDKLAEINADIEKLQKLLPLKEKLTALQEPLTLMLVNYVRLENPTIASDICMQELSDLLDFINKSMSDDEEAVKQFTVAIYGFLQLAVINDRLDDELLAMLKKIYEQQVFEEVEVVSVYQKLRNDNEAELPPRTADDLLVLKARTERYRLARESFAEELARLSVPDISRDQQRLNQSGYHLINTLDGAESLPIRYRIDVLHAARNLRLDIHNHEKLGALTHLIDENTDGKSSELMEVAGSIMMIAGAVLMAVSAFAAMLTLGFSSPISLAGLVLGGILFGSGVGLVAASTAKRTEQALLIYKHDVGVVAKNSLFKSSVAPVAGVPGPKVVSAMR